MNRIGVTANTAKPRAAEVLRRLACAARVRGIELFALEGTARLTDGITALAPDDFYDRVEALLALGGDGTMLRAVRELGGRDLPVMGLNLGSLGFLTSVQENDMERALDALARGDYRLGTRRMVDCRVVRGALEQGRFHALNDVVIANGDSARVITLGVDVDGERVTEYVCDGLIVSTPTGSTGHSLSAGGPIVSPESCVFVLSLICPHTLSSRPIVIPDSCEVSVEVSESDAGVHMMVDGQVGQDLQPNDRVSIRASERSVRFVHLPGYRYFAVLRHKLHWAGSVA
ncbi:MAG: NAD(+)/NADH kinase [Lentisphaerae bacterium]|nr:NAD(+)/NADH kinase [Lentisphaerota bacterium]